MKAGNPSCVMDRPQQRMLTSEFWSLQRSSAIPLRGSFAEPWHRLFVRQRRPDCGRRSLHFNRSSNADLRRFPSLVNATRESWHPEKVRTNDPGPTEYISYTTRVRSIFAQ